MNQTTLAACASLVAAFTHSASAHACSAPAPIACSSGIASGASVPANSPAFWVFQQRLSWNEDAGTAAGRSATLSSGTSAPRRLSFAGDPLVAGAEQDGEAHVQVAPFFAAAAERLLAGATVHLAGCEAERDIALNVTPEAPLPTSLAGLSGLVHSASLIAKTTSPGDCQPYEDLVDLDIELNYPDSFVPWRAVAFYRLSATNQGGLDDPLQPRPGRPYSPDGYTQSGVPFQRGNHTHLVHTCATAGKTDTITAQAFIPGLRAADQPAGASFDVVVPSCDALRTGGGQLIDDLPNTTPRAYDRNPSSNPKSGGGCSSAPNSASTGGAVLSVILLALARIRRRLSAGRRRDRG